MSKLKGAIGVKEFKEEDCCIVVARSFTSNSYKNSKNLAG